MKPETNTKNRKIYWIFAVINLIYGGVTLFMFIFLSYFAYTRAQFTPMSQQLGNLTASYSIVRQATRFRSGFSVIPLTLAFIGSLVTIASGVSLIRLLREKETKEIKRDVIDSMIMPDEKIVITELQKNNGALTQSELVRNTGLSKVKVHRIVKRLESLGIVKKYPYGVTNKIKLEKILNED